MTASTAAAVAPVDCDGTAGILFTQVELGKQMWPLWRSSTHCTSRPHEPSGRAVTPPRDPAALECVNPRGDCFSVCCVRCYLVSPAQVLHAIRRIELWLSLSLAIRASF